MAINCCSMRPLDMMHKPEATVQQFKLVIDTSCSNYIGDMNDIQRSLELNTYNYKNMKSEDISSDPDEDSMWSDICQALTDFKNRRKIYGTNHSGNVNDTMKNSSEISKIFNDIKPVVGNTAKNNSSKISSMKSVINSRRFPSVTCALCNHRIAKELNKTNIRQDSSYDNFEKLTCKSTNLTALKSTIYLAPSIVLLLIKNVTFVELKNRYLVNRKTLFLSDAYRIIRSMDGKYEKTNENLLRNWYGIGKSRIINNSNIAKFSDVHILAKYGKSMGNLEFRSTTLEKRLHVSFKDNYSSDSSFLLLIFKNHLFHGSLLIFNSSSQYVCQYDNLCNIIPLPSIQCSSFACAQMKNYVTLNNVRFSIFDSVNQLAIYINKLDLTGILRHISNALFINKISKNQICQTEVTIFKGCGIACMRESHKKVSLLVSHSKSDSVLVEARQHRYSRYKVQTINEARSRHRQNTMKHNSYFQSDDIKCGNTIIRKCKSDNNIIKVVFNRKTIKNFIEATPLTNTCECGDGLNRNKDITYLSIPFIHKTAHHASHMLPEVQNNTSKNTQFCQSNLLLMKTRNKSSTDTTKDKYKTKTMFKDVFLSAAYSLEPKTFWESIHKLLKISQFLLFTTRNKNSKTNKQINSTNYNCTKNENIKRSTNGNRAMVKNNDVDYKNSDDDQSDSKFHESFEHTYANNIDTKTRSVSCRINTCDKPTVVCIDRSNQYVTRSKICRFPMDPNKKCHKLYELPNETNIRPSTHRYFFDPQKESDGKRVNMCSKCKQETSFVPKSTRNYCSQLSSNQLSNDVNCMYVRNQLNFMKKNGSTSLQFKNVPCNSERLNNTQNVLATFDSRNTLKTASPIGVCENFSNHLTIMKSQRACMCSKHLRDFKQYNFQQTCYSCGCRKIEPSLILNKKPCNVQPLKTASDKGKKHVEKAGHIPKPSDKEVENMKYRNILDNCCKHHCKHFLKMVHGHCKNRNDINQNWRAHLLHEDMCCAHRVSCKSSRCQVDNRQIIRGNMHYKCMNDNSETCIKTEKNPSYERCLCTKHPLQQNSKVTYCIGMHSTQCILDCNDYNKANTGAGNTCQPCPCQKQYSQVKHTNMMDAYSQSTKHLAY